jgi:hypothetical protein
MVVALAAIVAAGVSQSASASVRKPANKHQGKNCSVVQDITERTARYEIIGSHNSAGMQIGDASSYFDEIYEGNSDKVIGNSLGIVTGVYRKASDNHLVQIFQDAVQLPDGTLFASGPVDRDAMLQGAAFRLKAEGKSGKFAGKKGYREMQILPPYPPPNLNSRLRIKIVLCG